MSVSHQHLKRLVAEMEQGVAATTSYSWLDLAQEVIRLRDGIVVVRDRCVNLSSSAQEADMHTLANEMSVNAKALDGLLKGDHDDNK